MELLEGPSTGDACDCVSRPLCILKLFKAIGLLSVVPVRLSSKLCSLRYFWVVRLLCSLNSLICASHLQHENFLEVRSVPLWFVFLFVRSSSNERDFSLESVPSRNSRRLLLRVLPTGERACFFSVLGSSPNLSMTWWHFLRISFHHSFADVSSAFISFAVSATILDLHEVSLCFQFFVGCHAGAPHIRLVYTDLAGATMHIVK